MMSYPAIHSFDSVNGPSVTSSSPPRTWTVVAGSLRSQHVALLADPPAPGRPPPTRPRSWRPHSLVRIVGSVSVAMNSMYCMGSSCVRRYAPTTNGDRVPTTGRTDSRGSRPRRAVAEDRSAGGALGRAVSGRLVGDAWPDAGRRRSGRAWLGSPTRRPLSVITGWIRRPDEHQEEHRADADRSAERPADHQQEPPRTRP